MPTLSASMCTRWQLSTERTSRDVLERTLAAGPGLTATTEQWLYPTDFGLLRLAAGALEASMASPHNSFARSSAIVEPC